MEHRQVRLGQMPSRTEIYSVSLTLSALIKAAAAKIGKLHVQLPRSSGDIPNSGLLPR